MEGAVRTQSEPMVQIVYTSMASNPFSSEALRDLLMQSRRNNHGWRISGLLVYDHGYFIQILEGPERHVCKVFSAIEADKRHCHIRLLLRQPIEEREYSEWAMGFVDITGVAKRMGGAIPCSTLRRTLHDNTRASQLMQRFEDGQFRQMSRR